MSAPGHEQDRLARVLGPQGPELSCEQCFEQLDRYVELELEPGREPDREIPGMAAHLQGCPACAEDHDSLRAYVAERQPGEGSEGAASGA